jgi:hypothetical protein
MKAVGEMGGVRGAGNVQNHPHPFLLPSREKAMLPKAGFSLPK